MTVRLERLLHTTDHPEGIPYIPAPPRRAAAAASSGRTV